jgi:hypothetical protein
MIKSGIDLEDDPYPDGIRARDLEKFEDLGYFSTEQYIFKYLDAIFIDANESTPGKVGLMNDADPAIFTV